MVVMGCCIDGLVRQTRESWKGKKEKKKEWKENCSISVKRKPIVIVTLRPKSLESWFKNLRRETWWMIWKNDKHNWEKKSCRWSYVCVCVCKLDKTDIIKRWRAGAEGVWEQKDEIWSVRLPSREIGQAFSLTCLVGSRSKKRKKARGKKDDMGK